MYSLEDLLLAFHFTRFQYDLMDALLYRMDRPEIPAEQTNDLKNRHIIIQQNPDMVITRLGVGMIELIHSLMQPVYPII